MRISESDESGMDECMRVVVCVCNFVTFVDVRGRKTELKKQQQQQQITKASTTYYTLYPIWTQVNR